MPILFWSSMYSIGIPEIDEQHKTIIKLLNTLYDAMTQLHGDTVLSDLLVELNEYAAEHFATEEGYMERSAYPELQKHHAMHIEFLSHINKLGSQPDETSGKLSSLIMGALRNWLDEHLCKQDRRFGEWYHAHNPSH